MARNDAATIRMTGGLQQAARRYQVRGVEKVPASAFRRFMQNVHRVSQRVMGQHQGRPYGRIPGAWVGELVDLHKIVLLCPLCERKFDSKRNRYYRDHRFPQMSTSQCDGCREVVGNATIFFHESVVGGKAGQVITPR